MTGWMRGLGLGAALLGVAWVAVPAPAQQSASMAVSAAVPSSYVVGPEDVLSMRVYGAPELADDAMRVDRNGTIHTPYGTTPVPVAGLTLAGVRTAIAAELVKDKLAVSPKVEVTVVQAESHPILITGAGIAHPGTIQAIQPVRLLDALNMAGGLRDNNAAQIRILRHDADGGVHQDIFTAAEVMGSASPAFNPWLHGGEQVRVIPDGDAYLAGAVATPGAYPISASDPLTVRKLFARAHGLKNTAKADRAQLIRRVGQPDQTVTRIDLPKILEGKSPDITLTANDMIYVPESGVKKVSYEAVARTLQVVTFAASYALTGR